MAKSPKQYSPGLQLVLIICFYIGFLVAASIVAVIICPLVSGYGFTELRSADVSIPAVALTWKILTFTDPVFMYLMPALLFVRIVSPQPVEWLNLNKPIRLWPSVFVIVILLLSIPMTGVLYDWNCTWSIAQSSIRQTEDMAGISNAIMKMPTAVHFFINLLLFALVSAIGRELFFRGVLQQILIRMMPKAPWIAIIITAAIYSVSYGQWQWLAPVFLDGILLGVIYYLTENIWLSILGSFITNSANFAEAYFYQQGWSNEDYLHPSPTPWYTALISLMLTAGLLWYFRKSIPKPVRKIEYQEDIASIGK